MRSIGSKGRRVSAVLPASPAPPSAARTPPHEMGRKLIPTPAIQLHTPSRLFTTRGPARSGRGWGGSGASWKAGLTHGADKTAIRGSKSAEVWLQYPPGLECPSRGGRKSPCAGRLAVSLTNSLATMPDGVPHPSYRQRGSAWRSRCENRPEHPAKGAGLSDYTLS